MLKWARIELIKFAKIYVAVAVANNYVYLCTDSTENSRKVYLFLSTKRGKFHCCFPLFFIINFCSSSF